MGSISDWIVISCGATDPVAVPVFEGGLEIPNEAGTDKMVIA